VAAARPDAEENNDWDSVHTLFETAWIKQEWGRYFEVVSIEPMAVDVQSMVVLRKCPVIDFGEIDTFRRSLRNLLSSGFCICLASCCESPAWC
jgi:hypothetical protein